MNKKLMALLISVISVTFTLASLSAGKTAASAQDAKAFVGTWERIAVKDNDGKVVEDRLVRAHLIFSADGHFSQTIHPKGRDKSSKPLQEMTKEELLKRFDGAQGFYGTYTINGNKLIRPMLTSLDPNREGTGYTFVHTFRFEGDLLILTADKFEARWQRVK